jgi:hypothetical protein
MSSVPVGNIFQIIIFVKQYNTSVHTAHARVFLYEKQHWFLHPVCSPYMFNMILKHKTDAPMFINIEVFIIYRRIQ